MLEINGNEEQQVWQGEKKEKKHLIGKAKSHMDMFRTKDDKKTDQKLHGKSKSMDEASSGRPDDLNATVSFLKWWAENDTCCT